MARLRSENPDISVPRCGRPDRLASLRLQDRWADWQRTAPDNDHTGAVSIYVKDS
ncbi:MAG TPA: hypothetical protein VF312_01850 [Propionibacteriaceae bacterium]|jgi:hypothetical protein